MNNRKEKNSAEQAMMELADDDLDQVTGGANKNPLLEVYHYEWNEA